MFEKRQGWILRVLIAWGATAVALAVAAGAFDSFWVSSWSTLLIAAAVYALVNAFVKPFSGALRNCISIHFMFGHSRDLDGLIACGMISGWTLTGRLATSFAAKAMNRHRCACSASRDRNLC